MAPLRKYKCEHEDNPKEMDVAGGGVAGPSGEEIYVGPIKDGSHRVDYDMARHYLARHYGPLQIGFQLNRLRTSARALVRTPSVEQRIRLLADALLRHGTLSGAELGALMAGLGC